MFDPAPLIATSDAPIPDGAEPAWISGAGGARLRAALFSPKGRARGSIVLSGGRTEPIEKYFEVIQDFLDRGFVVLAHDWRGQGLSHRMLGDPLKGHADGAKTFLDDFRILLDAYAERLPKPWVAVAHSMGGCLTLLAMAHGETRFAGAIFSAPMLGVQTGGRSLATAKMMTRISKMMGRARRYVMNDPGKPFDEDFEANALTHDRQRFERTLGQLKAEPQLALGAPTWGWLDFALRATAELARPERLSHITVPVIILSAEEDKLVDNAAQRAAARHLPQGKLINVPGAFHEILMETDEMRNIFMRAFDALTGRVAPKPAEPPKPAPPTPPKPAEAAPAAPA
ncbi:alpha/beta fold hydrolase, partial [Phenylobacterium soli]|uniref:alpha/beta fold hydrolase n=1 Tax=Phenylobacterium soli TaxID=2170551 RepID=UPI0036189DE6